MNISNRKGARRLAWVALAVLVVPVCLQFFNHRAVSGKLCGAATRCTGDNHWSRLDVQADIPKLPAALQASAVQASVHTGLVRRACDGGWTAAFGARIELDAISVGKLVSTQGACVDVGRSELHASVAGAQLTLDSCRVLLSPLRLDWDDSLRVSLAGQPAPDAVAACAASLPPGGLSVLAQTLGDLKLSATAEYGLPFSKADSLAGLSVQKVLSTVATAQELHLASSSGTGQLSLKTRPAADAAQASPELTLTAGVEGALRALLPEDLGALMAPGHPLQVRWNLGHESGVMVNGQAIVRKAAQVRPAGLVTLGDECSTPVPEAGRSLFFVQANDRGEALAPPQTQAVQDAVDQANAGAGALVALFVHGWQHSADKADSYVCDYADLISGIRAMEQAAARASGRAPRQVIGVFFGWPGAPYDSAVANVVTTFWDRLQAADRLGGAQAVLPQLMAGLAHRVSSAPRDPRADRRSAFVVAGHSMGARAVFSAIRGGLLQASDAAPAAPRPDLVLLINPAFSAELYRAVHDEQAQCKPAAMPVLLFSSETDGVTREVYPAGQAMSYAPDAPQTAPFLEHIYTAANFPAFVTHRLRMEVLQGEAPKAQGPQTILRGFQRAPARSDELYADNPVTVFRQPSSGYPALTDAWYRMRLEPVDDSASICPAGGSKVIEVDQRIVPDHGTIFTPPFMEYVVRALNHGTAGLQHKTAP
ncbi:MAG TPA: hypothetical protein VLA61_02170 [Ideonella sp.]|uniref:hypothetical protein n=1 Tax=Ideonella sp. TaxID=1929293 RepID=UPI002B641C08|nr:hypothetical protein [Ideonella sp.]HSI47057.1 hypothetical protein [Ideonella sp.]